MKAMVAVKRVIDFNVKARVKSDGSGVDLAGVKMSMNPFDEIAVEEAVRLKEAGVVTEVVAVSIGAAACQETLRTAMALGADRAVLVETARRARAAARRQAAEGAGRQGAAAARVPGQAGDRRRRRPDRPDAGGAAALAAGDVRVEGRRWPATAIEVTREVDGGLETLALDAAAVVTVDLRLNSPRYVDAAQHHEGEEEAARDAAPPRRSGVDLAPRTQVLKVSEPKARAGGIKVPDVAALVDKLKTEAKVI